MYSNISRHSFGKGELIGKMNFEGYGYFSIGNLVDYFFYESFCCVL